MLQSGNDVIQGGGGSTPPSTGQLFMKGQNPWIDISALGGADDARLNTATATRSPNTLTLHSAGTGFTAGSGSPDIGRVIAIAGGGPAAPSAAPLATSACTSTGTLALNQTYYVKTAFIAENGTNHTFLGESIASAEKAVITPSSCVSGAPSINIPSPPSPPTGVTAYAVYAGLASGAEFQQSLSTSADPTKPAVCQFGSLATSGYNACPGGHAVVLNNVFPEGPEPATVATWQTTIAASPVPTATTVTLTDAVLNDVTTAAATVWGTDNVSFFTQAISLCVLNPATGGLLATTTGCRIRFSNPTNITSPPHTGRYYMSKSLVIPGTGSSPLPNVVLAGDGGLGVTGLGGAGGFNQIRPTPEIVVGSRVWGVQVGTPATPIDGSTVSGFNIENLAFEDAIGQAFGGVAMMGEVDGAFLDRASMVNFTNGACLYLDGGATSQLVQIATIHKIRGNSCKYGIRSVGNASDIEIDGGTLTSSQVAGGIGIDFENNVQSANQGTGNIRVHDIAIRNFPLAHIKFVDIPAISVVQVKEENVGTQQAIGIDLESIAATPTCTGARIAFPVITSFTTGIQVGTNCKNTDIYKPFISGTATNIIDSGTNTSASTDENGVTLGSGTPPSGPTGRSVNITVPNATSNGPIRNQLVQLVSGSPCPSGISVCASLASANQQSKVIGIAVANSCNADPCVSTTTPLLTTFSVIAVSGIAVCQFDGASSVLGYVMQSPTAAGLCKTGTPPGEYIGILMDSIASNANGRVAISIQKQ